MEATTSTGDVPSISIVIPCYNEEGGLAQLYERLTASATAWDMPYEVIVVDDGSSDGSWQKLRQVHLCDECWKVVRLSRNFGHQTAVSAGLRRASGDAVIVMDADLQDPPEELHRFIEKWQEGYEVVYAVRRQRKEGWFKRLCYDVFYRLLACLSESPIPRDSGDFCLMDRRVVNLLNAMPERNRFVRGLRAWAGFRQVGLEYERQARVEGEPKYTFRDLVQLAVDGVFSFSTSPLRLATYFGFVVSLVAFLGTVFTFAQRIFADWFAKYGLEPIPGFATTVISVLFIGGVQLISLGIIGEYVGRVYDEVKRRPQWIEQEALGFATSSDVDSQGCETIGDRAVEPSIVFARS